MAKDLTLVHPDLRDHWHKMPKLPYNRLIVKPMRWLTSLMPAPKLSDAVAVRAVQGRAETGQSLSMRVYTPTSLAQPAPVLVWFHGGGMVIGDAKMDESYVAQFVESLGIVVVSGNYRLAPEHPFPAALDDCYAVLEWVHAHANELGMDVGRLAVGGNSAGGGLAAAVVQLAHDRTDIDVAMQLLVYPMLDDRSALKTDLAHPEMMKWTPKNNQFGWESYLQQPAASAEVPDYAVPARRTDLTGLPPAWIGVGSLDLFLEESQTYAQRLEAGGVACELEVVEGAFHGFDVVADGVPVVQAFRASQMAALRRFLL